MGQHGAGKGVSQGRWEWGGRAGRDPPAAPLPLPHPQHPRLEPLSPWAHPTARSSAPALPRLPWQRRSAAAGGLWVPPYPCGPGCGQAAHVWGCGTGDMRLHRPPPQAVGVGVSPMLSELGHITEAPASSSQLCPAGPGGGGARCSGEPWVGFSPSCGLALTMVTAFCQCPPSPAVLGNAPPQGRAGWWGRGRDAAVTSGSRVLVPTGKPQTSPLLPTAGTERTTRSPGTA